MRAAIVLFCVLIVILSVQQSEATYKKPMFNGSIFGKRTSIEYDSTNKALSALCEITTETCQAWYQTLEKK
ncbi:neuropeptide SIFamide-like [Epargyreus clarus]|uniref:neuropeptide SIFamide-like n=1 Tax=Epargyreus clarus TaxID=520877 RepID=UPI003C2E7573